MKVVLLGMLVCLAFTASGADDAGGNATGKRVLIGDDSKRHVAIINPKGEVDWEFAIGGIHDLHMLPNGNILLQKDFQHILEVSPDKKVVWSYDSSKMNGNEGKKVEVHAFQRLPDGSTMIAESGVSRIIEVDGEGKILHEMKLNVKAPNAHRDTRLVRKLANGNYLVAHEGEGLIREYKPSGETAWEFPVPMFDKKPAGGHGPEAFGNQAFSAIRLANGNTLIGTGNGHSVLEVNPAKEIVWSLKPEDVKEIQLAWITTLQALPNGNIIIGNCHAGPANPQIIEVTRDKKIVWNFKDFKNGGNSMPNSQVLDLESVR